MDQKAISHYLGTTKMARLESYVRLEKHYYSGSDDLVLGSETMYAIRRGNYFVTTARDPSKYAGSNEHKIIKYKRHWFNSRPAAHNAADKLNKLYGTDDFEVVEITL